MIKKNMEVELSYQGQDQMSALIDRIKYSDTHIVSKVNDDGRFLLYGLEDKEENYLPFSAISTCYLGKGYGKVYLIRDSNKSGTLEDSLNSVVVEKEYDPRYDREIFITQDAAGNKIIDLGGFARYYLDDIYKDGDDIALVDDICIDAAGRNHGVNGSIWIDKESIQELLKRYISNKNTASFDPFFSKTKTANVLTPATSLFLNFRAKNKDDHKIIKNPDGYDEALLLSCTVYLDDNDKMVALSTKSGLFLTVKEGVNESLYIIQDEKNSNIPSVVSDDTFSPCGAIKP